MKNAKKVYHIIELLYSLMILDLCGTTFHAMVVFGQADSFFQIRFEHTVQSNSVLIYYNGENVGHANYIPS